MDFEIEYFQKRRRTFFQCVVWFVVFIGSLAVVFHLSIQHVRLAFYGIPADATVVKTDKGAGGRIRAGSTMTFHFTTETGRKIEVKNSLLIVGGGSVGTIVPIIYLPDNPEIFSAPGIIAYLRLFLFLFVAFVSGISFWTSLIGLRS